MKKIITTLAVIMTSIVGLAQQRIYLSGTGIDDTRTWEFMCDKGQNSGKWKKIEVPCNWELQGFGDYTYGRYYTIRGQKPSDEVGTYRTTFKADKNWTGNRVKIFFDGVMTDTEVSINGQSAGEMHQGGFYRFSYDITSLLKFGGNNTLEVKVAKESSNRSINAAERKADWWLFGGIYRPVWLEVVPMVNMEQIFVSGEMDGTFKTVINLESDESHKTNGYTASATISDLKNGNTIQSIANSTLEGDIISIEGKAENIQTWSVEHPYLYTAKIDLKDNNGKVVQSREIRFGFRTVEFFPQDGLYVNGVRQVLKGINRHTFSVDGGRTTSKAMSLQDVKLIKQMNMNAVRSHYPPDEHFLDMCDSLGLLYVDELAGWQNPYDNTVGPLLLKEMIDRDANHPSIILWSNGNEGGFNYSLDNRFVEFDRLQHRHVIHAWADWNDLDTHHYPTYLTGVGRFTNGYKVFMPTEFMHAMYDQGGGAGLRDFWDRWQTNPMFTGGFIWVFCDEAPKRSDKGGILDSDGSNAPDGVVGPRREKEGSFYAIREEWCPIQIKPFNINQHFKGIFQITNEYLETNLSTCSMKYKVKKCPTPANGGKETILDEGVVNLPSINPNETGSAQFSLAGNFFDGDVLELEAFDNQGNSLCTWTKAICLTKDYFKKYNTSTTESLNPTAKKDDSTITLQTEKVKVEFDASNGMIRSIVSDDKTIPFKDGPVGVGIRFQLIPQQSYVTQNDGETCYIAKYRGGVDSIAWTLKSNGNLVMDATLLNKANGGGGFDDAFMDTEVYNLGLTFKYPESACSGITWMGRGPYRVWKNRIAGTNFGIWHKDYNNTITGESYENYILPEFKGYHANLYWATLESKDTPMTVYAHTDGIFLHLFTPEEPKKSASKTMPDFPEGDISFLLDIPSIQSFKPIKQQGPNSQPGNIRIKVGDEGLKINIEFEF